MGPTVRWTLNLTKFEMNGVFIKATRILLPDLASFNFLSR